MKIVLWTLLLFTALAHAQSASPPDAKPDGLVADFKVKVGPRMADGKPWRGMDAVFVNVPFTPITGTGQTKSAASLVLCTVSMEGDVQCPGSRGKDAKGRWTSPCHLSEDCDFNDIALPPGDLFGVVVLSMGIVNTVFADAAVFTRKKFTAKSTEYLELDSMLHDAVNRLAPSRNRDELERRKRPFQMFELEHCAAAACELRQSALKLVPS